MLECLPCGAGTQTLTLYLARQVSSPTSCLSSPLPWTLSYLVPSQAVAHVWGTLAPVPSQAPWHMLPIHSSSHCYTRETSRFLVAALSSALAEQWTLELLVVMPMECPCPFPKPGLGPRGPGCHSDLRLAHSPFSPLTDYILFWIAPLMDLWAISILGAVANRAAG